MKRNCSEGKEGGKEEGGGGGNGIKETMYENQL
jgi:hypothetical protein